MKKPNITKGEWKHGVINNGHEHFKDYSHYVSVPENEIVLCDILENHSFEESGSNAKAISAVPEMIDALISVDDFITDTRHCGYTNETEYRKISTMIEQALKKAGCYE